VLYWRYERLRVVDAVILIYCPAHASHACRYPGGCSLRSLPSLPFRVPDQPVATAVGITAVEMIASVDSYSRREVPMNSLRNSSSAADAPVRTPQAKQATHTVSSNWPQPCACRFRPLQVTNVARRNLLL
jgi:hypothetical protein